MATHSYSGFVDHTGDAGFRAWGSALAAGVQAAGLVQTADTGQINWASVARPGTNTSGGYEIYRFPDSSLYLKVEYGTASNATQPQMWITVGTGSNGSGTLTGQLSTRSVWTATVVPTSTSTNYTTYISVTNDHCSILWAQNGFNSSASSGGLLIVGKTVDSTGAATSDGYAVLRQVSASGSSMQCVRLAATSNTYADNLWFSLVAGNLTSSIIAGNNQAWHCWMSTPQMRPFLWAVCYIGSELAENNTFSAAMVDGVAHTYLTTGVPGANNNSATYPIAMLYE